MANWVYNSVSISGNTKDIKAFIEKAGTEIPTANNDTPTQITYEKPEEGFSFWNFVRPPQEALESGEYFGTSGFVGGKKVGDTKNNWYQWNIANWGTKWDGGEISFDTSVDEEKENSSISLSFQTAWDIPKPVFEAMVEQHPTLDFAFYSEEEQGWGEEHESESVPVSSDYPTGRRLSLTNEWGIPECHADYAKKDDLDGCRCANDEDPHEWYEDCESRQEELDTWHKDNKDCECVAIQEPDVIY
jgi:hypothetical protein